MLAPIIPETPWTELPRAKALLASCAASPPSQRYAKGAFGPHDGAMIYADDRVRELEAIWRAEQDRLFEIARVTDRYADFSAHCRNDAQSAISDRIATLGSAVESLSLEDDRRAA